MPAFPFNRTTTPNHDLVRSSRTYDEFSEHHHTHRTSTEAIVFKAQYMELDRRLLDLFSYVAPAEGNKATYSVTLATLIRNAASLFELGSRWLYPQAYEPESGKLNIFHYLSLEVITNASSIRLRSPVFYDTFSSTQIYQPFTNLTSWNRISAPTNIHVPAWWASSNELKHTNAGLKQYGTLENAVAAVGASFAFLHAVFGPGMVFGMYADGQGRIHSEVTSSVFIPEN